MSNEELAARVAELEAKVSALWEIVGELADEALGDDEPEMQRDLDGNTLAPRAPCNLHEIGRAHV